MKKALIISCLFVLSLASCSAPKVAKSVAYPQMYEQESLTVLLMPPINRTTNVEAKEYFHTTLNVPLANAGYYVIPPFLSMEILKKESAYDAELFLDSSLKPFGEIFGADLAVFTVINKWDKSSIGATVKVEVEYIVKSTMTNEVLYNRKGEVIYDASVSTGAGGVLGFVADLAISALNTAATKYVDVAKACNAYTFQDLPTGKYNPKFKLDGEELAGPKEFQVRLKNQAY